MNIKGHYDNHLASFYSWMTGDFNEKQLVQQVFFTANAIVPNTSKVAVDLGAGQPWRSKAKMQYHKGHRGRHRVTQRKSLCVPIAIGMSFSVVWIF